MSGMDIVKATAVLPSKEQVADELDRLSEAGDTMALNEVARVAEAYQQYEKRAHASERAAYFGTIKVMAEARIGHIDLTLHPGIRGSRLIFGDAEVSRGTRVSWRVLGYSLRAGQLDAAIRLAQDRYETVATYGVVAEARALGRRRMVSIEPLLRRYRELRASDGLTVSAVARQVDMSKESLAQYLTPRSTPKLDRMTRERACALAQVLGVDPRELKTVPSTPGRRPLQGRPTRKERKLPGGRLDEAYVLIRRAAQELDRATDGTDRWGTGAAWSHLYEAEDIVGRALKLAATSEGVPRGRARATR